MNMQYSKDGLSLTEQFESCRLMPYLDGGGVPTNGWGNTRKVVMGCAITQEQADADLIANVAGAVQCVNDTVTVELSQHQFDALVDFTFNCGCNAFSDSTLLKKLNAGDLDGACTELDRWCHDNGKVVAGLARRRDAEQALFQERDA